MNRNDKLERVGRICFPTHDDSGPSGYDIVLDEAGEHRLVPVQEEVDLDDMLDTALGGRGSETPSFFPVRDPEAWLRRHDSPGASMGRGNKDAAAEDRIRERQAVRRLLLEVFSGPPEPL